MKAVPRIRVFVWLALACAWMLPAAEMRASTTREAAMNLHWARDWLPPIFADAMQSNRSRTWQAVGTNTDLPAADLDADGWPTKDAEIALWQGLPTSRVGVYTMDFEGKATVSILWTSNATIQSNVHDSATNRSVVKFRLNAPSTQLKLRFASTVGGVRKVRVMLPIAPGSDTSHGTNEVVDRVMKTQLSKMSIVRYMDPQNTNSAPETSWSTRSLPGSRRNLTRFNPFAGATTDANSYGYVGAQTSTGIPFEYIIAIANATGTDAFVCVPAMADDTFIQKMAQVFRYGSNGSEPYTSTQSSPVWAPLNSGLKLYVEYSNEVWNTNGGFRQNHYAIYEGMRLVNANINHPINTHVPVVTGTSTASDQKHTLRARFTAWRAAETSRIFRGVFGDQMMTRVRPLFCHQIRQKAIDVVPELAWAHRYYLETESRGLSYFFWGGGPANYRDIGTNTASTVDDMFTLHTMGYQKHYDEMALNANIAHTFGLRFMTYEGGPAFGDSLGGSSTPHPLADEAFVDSRSYGKIHETQEILEKLGGTFSTLYVWHHGYAWAFVHPDTFSDDTHRANAVYDSRGATRQATAHGHLVPANWAGKNFHSYDPGWKITDKATTGSQTLGADNRAGYVIRSTSGGDFRVRIRYRTGGATAFHLTANGVSLAKISESAAVSTAKDSAFYNFSLAAGINGGISIHNVGSASVIVDTVTVEAVTVSVPTAPDTASATSLGSSSAEFAFTDRSSNETAFELAYKRSVDSTWTSVANEAAASGTGTRLEIDFTGLQSSTAYNFRARAINSAGGSAWVTASATTSSGSGATTTLAAWDFVGTAGGSSSAADSQAAGLTVSPASLGSGLTATAYNGGDCLTGRNQTAVDLAGALTGVDHIGFTLTPASGKTLSVTALKLRPISQNRLRTFTVFSSVAGFSAGQEITSFTSQSNGGAAELVVPISGVSGRTSAVEFRIYVHGGTGAYEAVGFGNATGNDLIVEGTIQ